MKYRKLILASAMSMALSTTALAGDMDYDTDTEAELALHTMVKTKLIDAETLNARDINIEVEDGIVQISGFVATEDQVELANDLLRDTENMTELRNHLIVFDETPGTEANIENTELTAMVKANVLTDDLSDAENVLVEVRDGVVLLSGFVDTETEREEAYQAAMKTEGVTRVINAIDIAS